MSLDLTGDLFSNYRRSRKGDPETSKAAAEKVTKGLGGQIAWPALLRKLDRIDPSFRD